ncbi:methyl-accepting chemotaxis protein [Hydrogenophaga sp.]|uniref:methyl-accepting chemotaxis protein n=1 Tax=Hydrogenophaga sp. TaxID=1904254 RepID=UPI003918F1F5
MQSRHQWSLRTRLTLAVVVIVLVGLVATVAVLTRQAGRMQADYAELYAEELARREAGAVQARIEEAVVAARAVAGAMGQMASAGRADRGQADLILRGVLDKHANFLGVWSGWEPNAFDGRDAEFVGHAGHDATGRYVPYWNRGAGQLQVEPLVDYDKPGVGDYYQLAKASGHEVMLEPYSYTVAGKDMLITTVTVPIAINGRFVGVAGVDIALASLQDAVSKVRVLEVGVASLISHGGVVVGDADAKRVGKPLPSDPEWADIRQAVGKLDKHKGWQEVPGQGEVLQIVVPVELGQTKTPWSFVVQVPRSKILEGVNDLLVSALWVGLVSVVVVSLVLSYTLGRLVLRPLGGDPGDASALAARVAQGDLRHRIDLKDRDASSLIAQLAAMQEGLVQMARGVRGNAWRVAEASNEIARANHHLSERTESQAASLEETSASMRELADGVQAAADTAQQANTLAQKASRIASEGGEVVGQVVRTMREINASLNRIADITSVINGIAFQTNILALNAAVEAARAGEQGRGFAVVAGEVRTLARRSADAAKEIQQLIDESVQRVDAGSVLVDKAGATMDDIATAIGQVSALIQHISESAREQSHSVQQIGAAVTQMDEVTQQNAQLVEEMAASADALKAQSDELVQAVGVFQLADGAEVVAELGQTTSRAPLALGQG